MCGRHPDVVFSSANQIKNIRDDDTECSTMDASMTINGTVAPAGVTEFAQEACEAVDALGDYMPMALAMPQPDLQDIKAYFARPRLIGRSNFTFGSTVALMNAAIDESLSALTTWFPQFRQRLVGAYGIRFAVNFRLQVAATAFHQGILALAWQYGPTSAPTFSRYDKSYACTNVPHVRLDISEDTMVELKVPFMHPHEFLEVTNNNAYTSPYGAIAVTPILPSVSIAGIQPATLDLYVYLTDIELFGAAVDNGATVTLQAGSSLITQEVKKSKVVSGTLSNMAKISGFIAKGIPSLAAIAGPAAWALDTASGIAKYFGFARPMIQDPASKVYRTGYGNEYQVDLPMVGDTVAAFQGNTLCIDTSLGGTDIDEMSLSFLTKQWSQACRLQVSTANSHGTAIYSAPVTPGVFWFRAGTTTPFSNIQRPVSSASLISQSGNCFYPTTLCYISSFFRYWRGSIKFRFTFAKTKLHGGRYMVTYNPNNQITFGSLGVYGSVKGPEVVGGNQQPYGNSMIMDLKDGNVFEFTVPYVSTAPYRPYDSTIGGITIMCIDPLQATATVSSVVPLLVEVCGGDDYELGNFSGNFFPLQPAGSVYTQSGGGLISTTTKSPTDMTMGERIMSIKQIIQIPNPEEFTMLAETSVNRYIAPWFVNTTYTNVVASTGLPNLANAGGVMDGGANCGGALAKCYAFVKGSTDFHVYPTDPQTSVRVFQNADIGGTAAGKPTALNRQAFPSSVPSVFQSPGMPVHTRLPSFQPFVRVSTNSLDTVYTSEYPTILTGFQNQYGNFYKFHATNQTSRGVVLYVSRSAGDDAQCAHFMGPVPIYIPNVGSPGSIDAGPVFYGV